MAKLKRITPVDGDEDILSEEIVAHGLCRINGKLHMEIRVLGTVRLGKKFYEWNDVIELPVRLIKETE